MLAAGLDLKPNSSQLIDVIPDKSLMPKIGKVGYSLSECIAELVDNSIQSFMDNYEPGHHLRAVEIRVTIAPQKNLIQVEDNASGMGYKEALNCFRLGLSGWTGGTAPLGIYGIGLKGASMALGQAVTVLTTKAGESCYYRLALDEKKWLLEQEWKLPFELVPKSNIDEHGTVIRITNLRRQHYRPLEVDKVRDDFCKRYAAFLKHQLVSIWINNNRCVYKPPELFNDEKFDFSLKLTNGSLTGWYGFLKQGSQIGQYGFDTFWHNRLITQYDKIGFVPHPTLARLIGEIHMDHVPVQTTKRGWQTESTEYVEAIESFRQYLEAEGVIRRARQLSAQAKITRQVKDKVEEYLDNVAKAMNSPEVLSLCPQDPQASGGGGGGIGEHPLGDLQKISKEVEDRAEKSEHGSVLPGDGTGTRIPQKTHKVPRIAKVGDKRYRFEHNFYDLGDEGGYKQWTLHDGQVIQVYSNTSFPTYHTTTDLAFYAVNHVAESLAEFICGEQAGWHQVEQLMNAILRKAGSIQAQL